MKQSDIEEFVHKESDFGFECEVKRTLIGNGFICEHGGTFHDPLTGKAREFDIRAENLKRNEGKSRHTNRKIPDRLLRLSVEVTKLTEDRSLVASATPRLYKETYTDYISLQPNSRIGGIRAFTSNIYLASAPAVRTTNLVSRRDRPDRGRLFDSADGKFFRKLEQAVASGQAWINPLMERPQKDPEMMLCFFPIVVVPDNTIWLIEYNHDGDVDNVCLTDQVEIYIGQQFSNFIFPETGYFRVSHVLVSTISNLSALVEKLKEEASQAVDVEMQQQWRSRLD